MYEYDCQDFDKKSYKHRPRAPAHENFACYNSGMNRKGFMPIVALIIVVGVLVIVGVGYYYVKRLPARNNLSKVVASQNPIATSGAQFAFVSVKSDEILQLGTTYQVQWTPCIDLNQVNLDFSLWIIQDTGRSYDTHVDLHKAVCDDTSKVETISWGADEPIGFDAEKNATFKSQFAIDETVGAGNNSYDIFIATSSWFYVAGPSWVGEASGTIALNNITVKVSGSSSSPLQFRPGDVINIGWVATVVLGRFNEHFNISLMPDGVSGVLPANPVVSNVTSGGIPEAPPYQWVIPNDIPPGTYQIRVDQYLSPECTLNDNCDQYTQYRQYTDGKAVYVKKFLESYYGISDSFEVLSR
jgi:hypothetical protein